MDKTSYIVLALCALLLFTWQPLSQKFLGNKEEDEALVQDQQVQVSGTVATSDGTTEIGSNDEIPNLPESAASSTNAPTNAEAAIELVDEAGPPRQPVIGAGSGSAPAVKPIGFEESLITLETDRAVFEFSNLHGGIHRVFLKEYPRIIECGESKSSVSVTNQVVLNERNNFDVMGIENMSRFSSELGYQYSVDKSAGSITFWKDLDNGLQLANQFTISTNDFQLNARTQIKNAAGSGPVKVPQVRRSIGSTMITQPQEMDVDLRLTYMMGDSVKKKETRWFENRIMGCFPGEPRTQFVEPSQAIRWAALGNQFFVTIVEPLNTGAASGLVANPRPVQVEKNGVPKDHKLIQAAFYYPEGILEQNESIVHNFNIYVGPKSFQILNKLPNGKHKIADFGYFGVFSKALLGAMNWLHSMGLSYALSILAITFTIKMLFWPLTHASTKSMKRMSKLQPQMKEIQEKYKEDPTKMQQKLMKFMKDNKVNPMGGCLPMFLQMPVFIGFFFMIRTAIELRGESFLWMCDLSQSDTVAMLGGFPVNPMPILMGITMLIQTRLTPPAAGMDPMQANMMRYMPLLFVGILYNYSSGLTMYWTFQNILSIAQTKLTKIDENKLGEVVVDSDSPSSPTKKQKRPKTWLEAKTLAMKQAQNKKKGKK